MKITRAVAYPRDLKNENMYICICVYIYIYHVCTVNVYNVYYMDESTKNRVLQEMLEASGMD